MKNMPHASELVAVLHDIRSIHNVGSIFRTADAAGIKKIYLCGITPTPLDRFGKLKDQFAKVSLGAEKSMSWEYAESILPLLDKLKKEGCEILAVEQAKGSVPYYDAKPLDVARGKNQVKLALVFGNEVKGIPKSVLSRADGIVEIPMRGKKESLNVSVAFGIVAFALGREL